MLRETLRGIHTHQDTSRLFAALGYEAVDISWPDNTHIVARWRGFKVIATEDPQPRERVKVLAKALGTTGERALAAVVGSARELALAAPRLGASGITRTLIVALESPSREALDQLEQLRPSKSSSALAHALRIAELLTSEAAGERFFQGFRVMLERMAGSLDRGHSIGDRRMAALLALTRVLFLYFVQTKGWLDGRRDYLRHLLDATLARRRSFQQTALHPLFFGTLNRPVAARASGLDLGVIPYLNGGLFEPHPVERRLGMATFSNSLWRDAFDQLFERFRFCVREASEVDAIAPDMLGRVFERLMDADARQASGTFYTPENIVHQVVEAAIETALCGTGLSSRAVKQMMQRRPIPGTDRTLARRALRRLRILDPAAGSGAFLLSALDVLTELRVALDVEQATAGTRQHVRRAVLRENLFGVDLNPMAVRLAELRLWLAVVADDPTQEVAAVAPLPNLDGVVRQGDTLLDPVGAARACHTSLSAGAPAIGVHSVHRARLALFEARGGTSRTTATSALRAAETALARRLVRDARDANDRALTDLVAAARSRDLFGRRAGLSSTQRAHSQRLRRQRNELRRAEAALDDGVLPFFSFEVHTPDVLAGGGFSVVIGNPPWVRAERLAPARRRVLQERFPWWRSTSARGYAHLPDLAVAFLQRAVELTAKGGAVGLLLPSKIASASYAQTARGHLVRETTVTYVHRVPDREARRFGATTYPLGLVLRNEKPPDDHRVYLSFDRNLHVAQRSLATEGPWLLVPKRGQDALDAFRASGIALGDLVYPALGVKTGANGVLVGELIGRHEGLARVRFGTAPVLVEPHVIRAALRGRDIAAFTAQPRCVVLWGYDRRGQILPSLPPRAARYVRGNQARLRGRADYRGGALWTLFRTRAALGHHRVVWADLARRPRAVVLEETDAAHAIPLNTCYVAAVRDRDTALVAAGVFNSTWAEALAAASADEARGCYRRINARVAAQMPIPQRGAATAALAETSALLHAGGQLSQEMLDDAVANALDLTSETRKGLQTLASNLVRAASPRP